MYNMIAAGFIPHITRPTHITDHTEHISATLIDHIFSNNIKDVSKSGIIITDISDHFATYHIIEQSVKHYAIKQKQIRKINPQTIKTLKNELVNTSFEQVLNTENPNEAYNIYI